MKIPDIKKMAENSFKDIGYEMINDELFELVRQVHAVAYVRGATDAMDYATEELKRNQR